MTFADIATTAFFPLHRLHKPAVVTKDGVDVVDGLVDGPARARGRLLDAGRMPHHFVSGVHVVYADDLLDSAIKQLVNAPWRRTSPCGVDRSTTSR